jgi:hypothetical protein
MHRPQASSRSSIGSSPSAIGAVAGARATLGPQGGKPAYRPPPRRGGSEPHARSHRMRYFGAVRFLAALVAVAALLVVARPAGAASRAHTLLITGPAQFDFTLASLNLRGPAKGLVATSGRTEDSYVAVAAERTRPQHVFILVVNRQPRGSTGQAPQSVSVRLETRAGESTPDMTEHANVLADGAPGQDCSALPGRPLFGSELRPLEGGRFGPFHANEAIARALDKACSNPIDSQFGRLVLQEPAIPHP